MMKYDVTAVGEVLFDEFPEHKCPGGAAANVAVIGAETGLTTALISAVGNDQNGRELLDMLHAFSVDTSAIAVTDLPTGRVKVTLNGTHPSYEICLDSAWDFIPFSEAARQTVQNSRTVVFGSLAQRSETSRQTIIQLLKSAPDARKIFDINIRQHFYSRELIENSLLLADTLKISEEELPAVAACLELPIEPDAFAAAVMKNFTPDEILFTCGAKGAVIYSRNEPKFTVPAHSIGKVVDTVGAGDAFLAGYIRGRIAGKKRYDSAELASRTAGVVCTVAGAWKKLPAAEL
ncbi:MAG: carbohydrate kinase [Lentisphaerae bacterium]|nr:carbohydrate kinase [Lentisphaerota bacterium]